jgi:hypothetical protein
MNKPTAPTFKATDLQLHIASLYYPILLQLAKDKTVITYKEMIQKAQVLNPNDAVIKNMIPVRSGDVLGVLYHFAEMNNLPRITTLIVKQAGECGKGISKSHDCPVERDRCFAFNWSAEQPKFWDFIAQSKTVNSAKRIRRVRLNFERALDIAWAYYLSNRNRLTNEARIAIEKIAKALCTGMTTEQAFAPFQKA